MIDPFAVYRETYHDQPVTDRDGKVFGHAQQDQVLDDLPPDLDWTDEHDVIEQPPALPRPKMIT